MPDIVHADTLRCEVLEKRAKEALKALEDAYQVFDLYAARGLSRRDLAEIEKGLLALREAQEHLEGKNDAPKVCACPNTGVLDVVLGGCPVCGGER